MYDEFNLECVFFSVFCYVILFIPNLSVYHIIVGIFLIVSFSVGVFFPGSFEQMRKYHI